MIHNIQVLTGELTDLKVISKRPISQHFKECMVVDIFANIIQVIVFTTCTDTLLAVYSTLEFGEIAIWIRSSQKDWLVLHAKI